MKIKNMFRLVCVFLVLFFLGSLPSIASAEIIDDITVHTDVSGEVNLVVKFIYQVQYVGNFPHGKTSSSEVYFNVLGAVPATDWQNYESHRAPPSNIIQDVTVSTMDKATGPKIQLKLNRPAEISVNMGKNGQSLVIHIKPENSPAPLAAEDAAPSGEITPPKVIASTVAQQSVHIPLGGKDGLPVFPDINLPVQLAETVPNEKPTLTEMITKANNEASPLMIQGGNAMLEGQAFAAVESFNKVLNLPPNKYTEDAQLWVGVAREKTGQSRNAILEYNAYLKLYPHGRWVPWVKDRLALFKSSQPGLFVDAPPVVFVPPKVKNTEFEFTEFGSLSMEAYLGGNQTNTTAPIGTNQSPTSISTTTQKSVMSNLNMTARSFNNEYDNRLVFQDFYSANYLPGQENSNRMGAAYYELKDRVVNYSVKIGRQSGMGGGVMGRFDGITAGYEITPNYKANIVSGQLSDITIDSQPKFTGVSLDFGLKDPFGGSLYYINQTVDGFVDRRAAGGNVRYFEPTFSVMSMFDYDLQFGAINILTVQGTINGGGKANDYNFLVDRRRSPILDLRNALNGTTTSLATLEQNGWTKDDLLLLANQRTTTSSTASVGMVNHLNEKWNMGTDVSYSITDALDASGTDPALLGGATPLEGFVAATPSSGPIWSFSERLTGMGVFQPRDVSNFSFSYTKSMTSVSESLQCSNHSDIGEKMSLDTTLGFGNQADTVGGKSNNVSPSARISYKVKNNLTLDGQLGLTWSKTSSSVLQNSSNSFQDFLSFGFRLDF